MQCASTTWHKHTFSGSNVSMFQSRSHIPSKWHAPRRCDAFAYVAGAVVSCEVLYCFVWNLFSSINSKHRECVLCKPSFAWHWKHRSDQYNCFCATSKNLGHYYSAHCIRWVYPVCVWLEVATIMNFSFSTVHFSLYPVVHNSRDTLTKLLSVIFSYLPSNVCTTGQR